MERMTGQGMQRPSAGFLSPVKVGNVAKMGDGTWVNGVWCAKLRPITARPTSAPAGRGRRANFGGVGSPEKRPASAPAVTRRVAFADSVVEQQAPLELPWGDYPLPTSELPGGLTASWLTGLFYRSGHLKVGSGIVVARVVSITDIYGGNGLVYRIRVAYGGPRKTAAEREATDGLPASFILKLYDTAELMPNAQRELLFYTKLASRCPIRVPRCFWAKTKPCCGATSRCPPESWPSLEDFLTRWCEFSAEPIPWDQSFSQSDSMSSSMSESTWGDSSAWDPDGSPRFRPSITEKYAKILRSAGIPSVKHLGRIRNTLQTLRESGIKQDHILKMVAESHNFEPRAVEAALLLEDLGDTPSSLRADGLPPANPTLDDSPAAIQMCDALDVVTEMAKLHAAWWQNPELTRGKHAALGLVGQLAREYNTNGPDWWDRLDDLWPALSKYVHKFQRLKKRYSSPGDVRRHQASRPMTLMHGDLHPANTVVTRKSSTGSEDGASSDGGVQVAIFDWAEINVSSGAEELAHFLLRSRFYEDVSTSAGGRQKQYPVKEVAGTLLQRYYHSLTSTGRGVPASTYPYSLLLEHVSLGILASAAKLVTHLEKLRAAHPIGPEPFGAPRWVLEDLKTRLSLLNLIQANCE